ncbi:hypothetical protein J4476_03685 [Candidatus Woesearchaeota archaeon]|nr:MAG: hypothetical protein QT09_C0007G0002 [archaeon GW2011_AR18]MBS3161769.1 hypothetical protein [Candidatus Woesearchaeota archaeon]HIH25334.1 hypothetical protein [Nanoarchaeota archaeon]
MVKCKNCNKSLSFFNSKILIKKSELNPHLDIYVCSEICKKEIIKKAEDKFMEYMNLTIRESKDYLCIKCSYKWTSKKSIGNPAICPKCKENKMIRYVETEEWKQNYLKSKDKVIKDFILEVL